MNKSAETSKGELVIRIAGAIVLVLGMAVSAQAQGGHVGGGAISSVLTYSGGGGAGFGSGGFGPSAFHTLPHIPPTHFSVAVLGGDSGGFVPSTFVPYEIAIEQGRSILASKPESLGQFARAYDTAPRPKAKYALVQDHHGYPVIRRR